MILDTKRQRGFTLLELLIVIAIIGVLTALATVSYSNAQKKARDAQRKSDLKAIQNAMEQYYADEAEYPESTADCNPGADYLPNGLPEDPRGSSWGYNYITCVSDSYKVCADLEGEGTINDGTENDFCVQSLQ